MICHATEYVYQCCRIRHQTDSGANQSVANDQSLLTSLRHIKCYGMGDHYTGEGYLPWTADNQDLLLIPCCYSAEICGTIILPTCIVLSHLHSYSAWQPYASCYTDIGYLQFLTCDGTDHTKFTLTLDN